MENSFTIDKNKAVELDKMEAEPAVYDYEEWKRLMHQPATVFSIHNKIEKDVSNYIKNKYGDYCEIKELKENDKHLKGYMYDSLVYRYKLALEESVDTRVLAVEHQHKEWSRQECEAYVRDWINKRDEMRFIEILNEAIGEHD